MQNIFSQVSQSVTQNSTTQALKEYLMDQSGQSHLNLEEVLEYKLKTGDERMEERDLQDLETIFAQVEDPRIERTKRHRLRDIIIIAMCGVICGADGWVGIEEFGKEKEAWFTEVLKLPNGIPSHETDAASVCSH